MLNRSISVFGDGGVAADDGRFLLRVRWKALKLTRMTFCCSSNGAMALLRLLSPWLRPVLLADDSVSAPTIVEAAADIPMQRQADRR